LGERDITSHEPAGKTFLKKFFLREPDRKSRMQACASTTAQAAGNQGFPKRLFVYDLDLLVENSTGEAVRPGPSHRLANSRDGICETDASRHGTIH
jgi:hypothetical protein